MKENKNNNQNESDVSLTTSRQGADTPSNVSNTIAVTTSYSKDVIRNQVGTLCKDTGRNEPGTWSDNSFARRSKVQRTLSESLVDLANHRDENQQQECSSLIAAQTTTPQQNPTISSREGSGNILSRCFLQEDDTVGNLESKEDEQLQACKQILAEMKQATKIQRNISKDVKNGICKLEEAIDVLSMIKRKRNRITHKSVTDSITLNDTEVEPATLVNNKSSEVQKSEEKENKITDNGTSSTWIEVRNKRGPNKTRGELQDQKSEHRKSKRKRRRRTNKKRRPDALVIRLEQGQTYAEILKEIKGKAKPEESNVEISAIRQTRAGNILLELSQESQGKETFSSSLKAILGNKGNVYTLESKRTIEIRDIDCCTKVEEVEAEVKKAIEGKTQRKGIELKVTVLRANSREQRVALVEMPEREAKMLIELTRVRIGWVNCRVRERAIVTHCFKCFGYGHTQSSCDGTDRRGQGLCRRCGVPGHIRKDCKSKDPNCFLCSEGNHRPEINKHVAGSSGCPVFCSALETAREKIRR